ncbi:MAG: hypothetical protein ACQR33_01540 [Candidatus Saccharibacteria bacterium]
MGSIVGFAGRAETGKSTAAEMLRSVSGSQSSQHLEFSEPILTIANDWMARLTAKTSYNEALAELQHVALETTDTFKTLISARYNTPLLSRYLDQSSDISRCITPETKSQHRQLLEWLGKGVVDHVSPTYWSDVVIQRVDALLPDTDLVTIGGIRSGYDAQAVRQAGGKIIQVTRAANNMPLLLTEEALSEWEPDFTIVNDGTLEDLEEAVGNVWRQILLHDSSL